MDKTTIVGKDGKEKYELTPDNHIVDLRKHCDCTGEQPIFCYPDGVGKELKLCLTCQLPISEE